MITLDAKDGLSWELVALLEVAAEEAGYDSPESFIIDTVVKEAGKVLAKIEAKTGSSDTNIEGQLDLFKGEN